MSDHQTEDIEDVLTKRELSIPVGVVLEKRKSTHPWGDWILRPVSVLPGAGPVDDWVSLHRHEDVEHFHIATLPLTLHRKETEAFKINIESESPHLYVVMREDDESDERPISVHVVTASPYDAQDYMDTSEDLIEKVPMPDSILEWIKAFINEHHVEETFKKRRRDKLNVEDQKFGKQPIFASPTRH